MPLAIIDYNLKNEKNIEFSKYNKIIKRTGTKSMIHEYDINNVAFNTHTHKEKKIEIMLSEKINSVC